MYATGEELLFKIDSEGGPYEAIIEYGIKTIDVPEYLQREFANAVIAGEAFRIAVDEVVKKIRAEEGVEWY